MLQVQWCSLQIAMWCWGQYLTNTRRIYRITCVYILFFNKKREPGQIMWYSQRKTTIVCGNLKGAMLVVLVGKHVYSHNISGHRSWDRSINIWKIWQSNGEVKNEEHKLEIHKSNIVNLSFHREQRNVLEHTFDENYSC